MAATSPMPVGEEVVDLLSRLVAFPTESRSPNRMLVDHVADLADGGGASVTIVEGPEGRANLVVRFGPEAPGGVLVAGHTDVVPAGNGWATDPYQLTVDGDRLLGRGTADMKGFVASALVVALRQDVARWNAPLFVALSYDEEIGCAGVPSLLAQLADDPLVRPEVVVVGEPTGLRLCTEHPGKVAYHLAASCAPGHSSQAPSRTNAVQEAVSVALSVIAVNSRSSPECRVSTNVGTIGGGVAVNVLAPTCELTFECRHPAGVDPDQLLDEVWHQVDRSRAALMELGGALEVRCDARYPGLHVDEHHPAVQKVARVLGTQLADRLDFGTEAGLYTDALGIPSVVYGPGDIRDAHRPDEFVERRQLESACMSIQNLADLYCHPMGGRALEAV